MIHSISCVQQKISTALSRKLKQDTEISSHSFRSIRDEIFRFESILSHCLSIRCEKSGLNTFCLVKDDRSMLYLFCARGILLRSTNPTKINQFFINFQIALLVNNVYISKNVRKHSCRKNCAKVCLLINRD